MNIKNIEPTFQLIANGISEIQLVNTIVNISNSDDLIREFSINIKDISIEEHETYKSAGLDVEVKILVAQKETEEPKKFETSMIVSGVFLDSKEISNEMFEDKLKLNGVAALYSIARGCITNISSQALADGKIVLPLVNFMEFSSESDD